MILLTMLRHGRTDWNSARRIQGHTDTALSVEGRREVAAMELPDALRGSLYVCSPLRRARETATILGLDRVDTVAELREMCWGDWEGQAVADLRARQGATMTMLEARGLDFCPPGGESPRQVQERLRHWFGRLLSVQTSVFAVTHKGVIRAAMAMALDWDMLGPPPRRLDWCRAQVFRLHADGRLEVWRSNVPMLRTASIGG
jgi:probable phosphoglycerate mutase